MTERPVSAAAERSAPPERPDGTPARVLVVDDEQNLADVLGSVLRNEGWSVRTAYSGLSALDIARAFAPDVVVLDVMLPDLDGLDVLHRLRQYDETVSVLFLTARDDVSARIAGITAGGDDYVVKPFSLEEVLARLRGLLRRSHRLAPAHDVLTVGDLVMDEDAHDVTRAGDRIALTATEFELLRYLMRNPRRVLSKAQILDRVWKYDFGGQAHVVELYISYLRKKIDAGREPLLHTVRGAGYMLPPTGMIRLRRLTLRSRLTLTLSTILVVAVVVSGVAGALLLRASLVTRLDQELGEAGGRFAASLEHGSGAGLEPGGSDGDADNAVPGQSVGTLGVRLIGGAVQQAAVVTEDGRNTVPHLSAADAAALARVPVGRGPRTVELSGLGDYRLEAVAGRDGDVQLTGLPLRGVDDTVSRLATIEAVVLVVVVLAAGGATLWSVRRSLRPLEDVVATATHVAELPLTEPGVVIPVEPSVDEPRTEVQQVAFAFDRMLGHVRAALAARDETEVRLRRFVADASHELRTPLATIRAYAEFAHRDRTPLPAGTEQALTRIEAASDRMSVLVEELLVLARLDESRPFESEPVDVVQTVAEIVMDARTAHPDHRWVLELPDDAVTVEGDPDALHRAIENLVRNAAVHTPPGTTVRTSVAAARSRLEVVVADDGPGIPADQLAAVFDRFTRVDPARSHGSGGTGLGLAITRGVVRAHGGAVRLTSVPGDTRFVVDLPVAPPLDQL